MTNNSMDKNTNAGENMFSPAFIPDFNRSNEPVRENYNSTTSTQSQVQQKPSVPQNPLLNTLSMLGPLASTMFQVVVDKKPPHPDELFQNIDIKSQMNKGKIVEIEDDENDINPEDLDNELKDELDDLKSSSTTALNTPMTTPRLTPSQSPDNLSHTNISNLDLCENGVCKLNLNELSDNEVNEKKISTIRQIFQLRNPVL